MPCGAFFDGGFLVQNLFYIRASLHLSRRGKSSRIFLAVQSSNFALRFGKHRPSSARLRVRLENSVDFFYATQKKKVMLRILEQGNLDTNLLTLPFAYIRSGMHRWHDSTHDYRSEYGYVWARVLASGGTSRDLRFRSTYLNSTNNAKGYGFNVREQRSRSPYCSCS